MIACVVCHFSGFSRGEHLWLHAGYGGFSKIWIIPSGQCCIAETQECWLLFLDCLLRNEMVLCWNPELSKVPSVNPGVCHNAAFHAPCPAWNFYIANVCFPGSFSFIFPKASSKIEWRVTRTVSQTLPVVNCVSPCYKLDGLLCFKYQQ